MTTEMWGAQGGSRQAELDIQQGDMNAVSMAHTLGQMAMQPAQMRLLNAEAGTKEAALAQSQKLQAALAQMGTAPKAPARPGVNPMAQQFYDVANLTLGLGLPTEAAKYAEAGSKIMRDETTAIAAKARAQKDMLTAQHQQLQLFEGLTRGVSDQEGWDAANTMYQRQTGLPSPYAGVPFSPELLETVRSSVLTAKDALNLQLRQEENTSKDDFRAARKEALVADREFKDSRMDLARRREERLAKNGAGSKGLGAPTKSELESARAAVRTDMFAGVEVKDLSQEENDSILLGSQDLVGRAKAAMKMNSGLDFNTALNQAFAESKANGEWEDVKKKYMWNRDSKRYLGKGKGPESAVAVPAKKEELVAGRWYKSPNGQVGKWDGSKFVVGAPAASERAPAAAAASGGGGVSDESDDEEEGDE